MIEITDVNSCPAFESWFAELEIPGQEMGLAVGRRWHNHQIDVCLGLIDGGAVAIRSTSNSKHVSRTTRRLSRKQFEELVQMLDRLYKRTAIIGDGDTLDGESYFIKWIENGDCYRLVLCNPREIDDQRLSSFVEQLDLFIKSV